MLLLPTSRKWRLAWSKGVSIFKPIKLKTDTWHGYNKKTYGDVDVVGINGHVDAVGINAGTTVLLAVGLLLWVISIVKRSQVQRRR